MFWDVRAKATWVPEGEMEMPFGKGRKSAAKVCLMMASSLDEGGERLIWETKLRGSANTDSMIGKKCPRMGRRRVNRWSLVT